MQLENFKVWHWMVIGLLVGLGMGYWQVEVGPNIDRGVTKTIYQEEFERKLFQTYMPEGAKDPAEAQPIMTDLLVRPMMDGKVWVTGSIIDVPSHRRMRELAAQNQPITAKILAFRYPTEVPYKPKYYASVMDQEPKGASDPADRIASLISQTRPPAASVLQYLQRVKAERTDAKFTYRFAWWQTKPAVMGLWTGGAFVIIGGIWPVLVRLIVGAGFGPRQKAKSYDLERFKGEKSKVAAAKSAQDENQKLADLNTAMEARLAGFATENESENEEMRAEEAEAEARIRALPTGPLEPSAAAGDSDEPKEYTGEFYPVVKSGSHVEHPPK